MYYSGIDLHKENCLILPDATFSLEEKVAKENFRNRNAQARMTPARLKDDFICRRK